MNSQLSVNEGTIDELRQCAALISEKLQKDEYDEASVLINTLTEARDKHIFQSVGKLTRGLHDAIVNFNVDADKSIQDNGEINDASSRLEYVIDLTQNAAEKTMDMVEACAPLSLELGEEAMSLKQEWSRLKAREMTADEFRELYKRLDQFFGELGSGTNKLNENLQNIILEQGFQDLTGQVLKKVISLITEVESSLVSLMRIAGQVEGVVGIKPSAEAEKKAADNEPNIEGEGPQHKAEKRDDVVNSQDEVDDLLSSLGF